MDALYDTAPRRATLHVYLGYRDADAALEWLVAARAVDPNADVVWTPAASEWNYRCRVRDSEGREWTKRDRRDAPAVVRCR